MKLSQQLRIGNLIVSHREYFDEPTIGVVYQINDSIICFEYDKNGKKERICNPVDQIAPIPITEDWIIKHFDEVDDDGLYKSPDEELFQIEIKYLEDPQEYAFIWDAAYTEAPCEFIHQLQNLHFALTGIELEIKL